MCDVIQSAKEGVPFAKTPGPSSPSGIDTRTLHQVPLAEWSKATDSSSVIFGCAGSNPAGYIFLFLLSSTVVRIFLGCV